ncbi:MAG: permease [Oscillospiraceae bacterium]|nr:permease [Oscillospiraceae bacterium]
MMHEVYMIAGGILFQLRLIGPYWISGLLAGSLVSVYLSRSITGQVAALSSRGLGLWQTAVAAALGIASPLCMFGTVPVIAALGKKGLPNHLLCAFMISSVALNPNLLLLTAVLGRELMLIRLCAAFAGGLLAGLLVRIFWRDKPLFLIGRFETSDNAVKKRLLPDLFKAIKITAPYLLFGVTLTALLDRYIPPEWIYGMFGGRRGLGVLFATTLSIPLYACGGGTIPLLNAWLHAGMGRGDALAFMLAGPATKVNNLSAVKMILGGRMFAVYLAYSIGFAVLAGLLAEFLPG